MLAGWKPEAWQAEDLLNRTEAFTASADALDEVFRARLIATVGLSRARLLLAGDRPLDVPAGLDPQVVPDLVGEALRRVGTPPFFIGLAGPVTDRHGARRCGCCERANRRRAGSRRRRAAGPRSGAAARSSVASLFRSPHCAGMERDRRDRAVAAGCRRGAQRSRRLDRRGDRRRHTGRLHREAEPGEPASGGKRRNVDRYRRAPRSNRRARPQDAGRLRSRDDPARRGRRVRPERAVWRSPFDGPATSPAPRRNWARWRSIVRHRRRNWSPRSRTGKCRRGG